MPSKFKALASIAAWALFVMGLGTFAWSSVESLVAREPYPFSTIAWLAFGTVTLFLSVVVMRWRQSLE
ncbi:MAG: hypothetical protein HY530_06270 [Chloroflexi bacterium]|nr:hypothetical protein [Chloroflexota bacterium]